jgi:DnaK suppressor protein
MNSQTQRQQVYRQALLDLKAEVLADADRVASGGIETVEEERADTVDRSSLESERNFTIRLLDRERKLLHKVDEALERLDAGEFGFCEECGEEIGFERLVARPVATLCIECKTQEEDAERRLV